MPKNTFYYLLLLFLVACSRDTEPSEGGVPVSNGVLKASYEVERLRILEINPKISEGNISWKINGEIYSNDPVLEFISNENKTFTLTLEIENQGQITTHQSLIKVKKETTTYSPFVAKVWEYRPAVGQFVNLLPQYSDGDTYQKILEKANEILVGDNENILTLGGFGGYVVLGFDHTIPNFSGADFRVFGNAFQGSHEPAVVMVSQDKNKNGLSDDEWFEIAGSEYLKPSTIKNYAITYHKPNENNTDEQYLKWEDNLGNMGFRTRNQFHRQSYFPLWISDEKMVFTGTKLADNYTQKNGIWTATAPAFGYADVSPNGDEMDISWAVDKNGKAVKLVGIDFVKIYTATHQEAGWLGEISSEIKKVESIWGR